MIYSDNPLIISMYLMYDNRCIYNQLLFNILQVISQKYGRNL